MRYPRALLSREDTRIWLRINLPLGKPAPRPSPIVAYLESDRRDAELMLGAQLQPLCIVHWRYGLDHLILLRGPPPGEKFEWMD